MDHAEDTKHREFRSAESYAAERETRDMLAGFLRERGFDDVEDKRTPHGANQSQAIVATAPGSGARIAMRIRLCWYRDGNDTRARRYSAAQLLATVHGDDWEGTLREKLAREKSDGITHFLVVQREAKTIIYAALIPLAAVLPIWLAQYEVSKSLIEQGRLGNKRKNHAKNGSSPTIWLQDDKAPAVAEVLWNHDGVRELAKLTAYPKMDHSARPAEAPPEEVLADSHFWEGAVERIQVNRYERDPRARRACLEHYGTICAVCCFDFGKFYGDSARDFIHVHHLIPLSAAGTDYCLNPIQDLRPLCANCHAVVHRREPPYSILEVQEFIRLAATAHRRPDAG